MKFYLVKILTNDKEQDGTTIGVYEGDNAEDRAKVAFHQTLSSYHNAADVLYAVVEILDEYGRILGGDTGYREVVDHRPQPEAETERSSILPD
ncbi:MAG: hypothetical protein K6F00_04970 [Lachnospiraceae bacterium]|nr:hypothetical protein [Lachnospiraceae bacterium]